MLTEAHAPAPIPPVRSRRAARVAALRPTARVSQPHHVLVTMAAAATPLVVTVSRSGEDLGLAIVLLGLTAGASLGWTVDDPASEILAPLPIDHRYRLGLRLSVAATIVTLVVVAALALSAIAGPGTPPDIADRLPEVATAAAVAVAIGLAAVRTGNRAVGPGAVTAGLLVPGAVAALAVRWPHTLPSFTMNQVHDRWWWLAALAGALAVHLANAEPR